MGYQNVYSIILLLFTRLCLNYREKKSFINIKIYFLSNIVNIKIKNDVYIHY